MKSSVSETSETSRDRRARLAREVTDLAAKLDAGTVTPRRETLRLLAEDCDRHQLSAEAARVRRWMGLS